MVKKSIVLLLLIVSVSLVVAGCTTNAPSTSPGTSQPTTQTPPATIGTTYATAWPTMTGAPTGPGDLHGKITKAGTNGEPYKGVVIYVWADADDEDTMPAFAKAVTDANGEYKISNLPNGYYQIRITPPGSGGYHDAPPEEVDGPTEYNNEE